MSNQMFIVRSFFGGELMTITVTPAISLEAAKDNFLAWCDPRMEAVTVEPCGLGRNYDGTFFAVQEGYVVAFSFDLLMWKEFNCDEEGTPGDWDNYVDVVIC